MCFRLKTGQKGAILLSVLFVLVFLSIFGAILVGIVYNRAHRINLELDRIRAIYLAEAGLSKALYELKSKVDPHEDGLGNIKPTRLGSGTYQTAHSTQNQTITSWGTVNEVTRIVEIRYEGL